MAVNFKLSKSPEVTHTSLATVKDCTRLCLTLQCIFTNGTQQSSALPLQEETDTWSIYQSKLSLVPPPPSPQAVWSPLLKTLWCIAKPMERERERKHCLFMESNRTLLLQEETDTSSLYHSKLSLVPPPPSPQAAVCRGSCVLGAASLTVPPQDHKCDLQAFYGSPLGQLFHSPWTC
ncbi:hypothetical protein E2C01_030453 [Portunus trituberculatus]|uniref:Uncharacterized protein n=1 Tax=Portunus trituberculatus TaxID=210409 RepID=A0A5B7EQG8_PORTR|nr:hypothetical protein [Portunus trituberculatus]